MKPLFTKFRVFVLLLLVVIGIIAVSCKHRGSAVGKKIEHIVLISIDTCRADYLGCYGYPENTTPNIDKLAQEGILFENVVSPVPMTLPAHSSMLTGAIPVYHGVHDNFYYWLGESNVTIAEILKDKGFSTGAVISAFVMDSQFGIAQGFDTYNDTFEKPYMAGPISERKGDEVNRFAIEWLEENKKEKFFLFLHYFDPHGGYKPPEPFASKFRKSPYAGEIAFTDHCIGRVLDKLKELALYDSTLIIITGDHGEMLGEHEETHHSYFIYESAIKVPLIFKLPGRHKPRRIKDIVGLVDIVPTVCSLLDIEMPKQVQGVNLWDYFEGDKAGDSSRYLYCESLTPTKYNANPLLGVVTSRYKYIQTTRQELYDLIEDPEENNNIIDQNRQLGRVLQEELRDILELSAGKEISDSRIKLDLAAVEQLKGLGYVDGRVRDDFEMVHDDFEIDQTKEDPKDLIVLHKSVLAVENLITDKRYVHAKTLCNSLLSQGLNAVAIRLRLAKIASELDDPDEMINQCTEILRLEPDHLYALNNLGFALHFQGKFEEAIDCYRQALGLKYDYTEAHHNFGNALASLGRGDEAISRYRIALEFDKNHVESHVNLAISLMQKGQVDEAVEHFAEAVRLSPDNPQWRRNLEMALARQKKERKKNK